MQPSIQHSDHRGSAVEAATTNDTGGNINRAIGVNIPTPVNAGTIGQLYGVRVEDLSVDARRSGARSAAITDNLSTIGCVVTPTLCSLPSVCSISEK